VLVWVVVEPAPDDPGKTIPPPGVNPPGVNPPGVNPPGDDAPVLFEVLRGIKPSSIVTEEAKPFHIDWTGPAQLVNEIDRDKFEVFNMFNFGVVKNKPASTGLTLIRKK
jgi:hypothetical protein